ncbi:hypothetical protein HDU82_000476 [Entophlyctis luteolus]|nr:hypothetical protein HDU82_000476 [Entophlyctis luteolus]
MSPRLDAGFFRKIPGTATDCYRFVLSKSNHATSATSRTPALFVWPGIISRIMGLSIGETLRAMFKDSRQRTRIFTSVPTNLAIARNPEENNVFLDRTMDASDHEHSIIESENAIMCCFENCPPIHPDRLIYSVAGIVFDYSSPRPFGGPRRSPGYLNFAGNTPGELLTYIIREAFAAYWSLHGESALNFVVGSVNKVLQWHMESKKSQMDEVMLRGMKRAGHSVESSGLTIVPEDLRDLREDSDAKTVFFTPNREATEE